MNGARGPWEELMQLGHVLADDRAVSPVIGVILMVGITVALASVVGVFVLGVDATTSVPDASFRYDAETGGDDNWDDGDEFVIHHDGGEDVNLDHVSVQYAGTDVTVHPGIVSNEPPGSTWEPGETWKLEDDGGLATDQQVLVLWTSANGKSSQILESGDLP